MIGNFVLSIEHKDNTLNREKHLIASINSVEEPNIFIIGLSFAFR